MERTRWVPNSNVELCIKCVKVCLLFFCVVVVKAEQARMSPHSRIVGGTQAQIKDYPSFVALFHVNFGMYCGGTYIHELWILTVAHCVVDMDKRPLVPINAQFVKARMGISSITDVGQIRDGVEILAHKNFDYNDTWTIHDIGLIKIDRKFDFDEHVKLGYVIEKYPFAKEVVSVGYGITKPNATEGSWNLMKVDLKVTGETEWYLETRDEKGAGPCQGDSGGPLYLRDDHTTVVGVVSYGNCSGGLTWFAHVYKYRNWIFREVPRSGETARVLVRNRNRFVILVCYLALLPLFDYHLLEF